MEEAGDVERGAMRHHTEDSENLLDTTPHNPQSTSARLDLHADDLEGATQAVPPDLLAAHAGHCCQL